MQLERLLALLLLFSFAACNSDQNQNKSGEETPSVVYGEDGRKNISQIKNPYFLEYAYATAAKINNERLQNKEDGIYIVEAKPLGQTTELCKGERFYDEPDISICTGFLISKDKLVTAGHCVKNQLHCENYSWAFQYNEHSVVSSKEVHLREENVYKCKKVLDFGLNDSTRLDYAVIQLDRPVTNRLPLRFRRSGKVSAGTELVLVGHPSGVPQKISDGGKVLKDNFDDENYFRADVDAFSGDSGSPVINIKTGKVEGILVGGAIDYNETLEGCRVVNVCPDGHCPGERISRITSIPSLSGKEAQTPAIAKANSCKFANDNSCDDGRPGSEYAVCEPGTDENDCSRL